MSVELFLSHANDHAEALPGGLSEAAVGLATTGAVSAHQAVSFLDDALDPADLAEQRWGVVAPLGPEGDRLLALVAPLLRKRHADQGGHPVRIYRVPPGLSADQAVDWKHQVLEDQAVDQADIPRYLLLLGQPDQVSLDFQSVLSVFGCVGRLAFDQPQQYEAYVEKLLRWEAAPKAAYKPHALLYTARDGTAATTAAWDMVMDPVAQELRKKQQAGKLAVDELSVVGELFNGDPGLLMTPAARPHPSVLFTMSHGLGAPRGGWGSEDQRRAVQGALKTGRGSHLEAQDLAQASFLPGGLWFFFACFGLGTPAASDYTPWLRRLRDGGAFQGRLDGVLAGLPAPGEPPFFAAVPKAALANPRGPLAVIGHIDLAWSYSFQDLALSADRRFRAFQTLVEHLGRSRAGLALNAFLSGARARATQQADLVHADAQAAELGVTLTRDQVKQGHRWMCLRDLRGYMLLGDPAAQLPEGPAQQGEVDLGPALPELIEVGPGPLAAAVSAAPAASFAAEAEPARAEAPPAVTPPVTATPDAVARERAVLHLLRGTRSLPQLEAELGVGPAELLRWALAWVEAGKGAVGG